MSARSSAPQLLRQMATPAANPPSGSAYLYLKSDGHLYYKNSAGVETKVDSSGGGGSIVLDDITNVAAPTPEPGQVLTFDGTNWVALDPEAGTEPTKVSSIYGYGGSTTTKNAASPALIDLDYLGADSSVAMSAGSNIKSQAFSVPAGDIDVRVKARADWEATAYGQGLANFWETGALSFAFFMRTDRTLRIMWTTDGATYVGSQDVGVAAPASWKNGDVREVRFTFARSGTVTFYERVSGSWVVLGSPISVAAGGPKVLSTSMSLGTFSTDDNARLRGAVYSAQLYEGVGGTLLADFDADDFADKATAGATATDSTGKVWTLSGANVKAHSRKVAWLPGTTGNYFSTPDKNELDYESSAFTTSVGTWYGLGRNLLTANQSSLETDLSGYTVNPTYSVNVSLARSTAQSLTGVASLAMTAVAAGSMVQETSTNIPAIPGQVYTAVASFRAATTPRRVRVYVWYPDQNVQQFSPWYADNAAGWTQVAFSAQAPPNATVVRIGFQTENAATGEVHYVDAAGLFETPNANLAANPDFENGITGVAAGSNSTPTYSQERPYIGTGSLRIAAPGTGDSEVHVAITPVSSGQVTISAYVYQPIAGAAVDIWYNGVSTRTSGVAANTWARVSATFTASDSATDFRLKVNGMTPGQVWFVDALQIAKGSTALPYLPPRTTNLFLNTSSEVDASLWHGQNTTLARSTTRAFIGAASLSATTTSGTQARIAQTVGELVSPGRQYTYSAYFYTTKAGVTVLPEWGGDSFAAPTGPIPLTQNAWTRVVTTHKPSVWTGNLWCQFVVSGLTTGQTEVWMDAAQLEHGSVATPYVDGSLGAGFAWDPSENLVSNPSFETDTTGWNVARGTIARSTSQFTSGTASLEYTSNDATGANYVYPFPYIKIAGSQVYSYSAYLRGDGVGGQDATVNLYYYDAGGSVIGSGVVSTYLTLTTSWQRFIFSHEAPANAVSVAVYIIVGSNLASGRKAWIDAVQVEQRPFATPYGQTGAAHASTSTRQTPWVLGGTALEGTPQQVATGTGKKRLLVFGSRSLRTTGYRAELAVSPSSTYTWSTYPWWGPGGQTTNPVLVAVDATSGAILGEKQVSNSDVAWTFTTGASTTKIIIYVVSRSNDDVAGTEFYLYMPYDVQLEKAATATAYVPPLRITGDLDVRAKVALEDWTPAQTAPLLNRYGLTAGAIHFSVLTSGLIRLGWNDGSAWTPRDSTVATGLADGAVKWVRATLDVDNGAGGHDVKFYTSDDGVTWAQLGATVTTAGVTQVSEGPGESLCVGRNDANSSEVIKGKVAFAQVRAGIDGPIVADFRPEEASAPGTSWTDGLNRVWTVGRSGDATAEIVDRNAWAFTGSEYLTLPDRSELDFWSGDQFTIATSVARRPHSISGANRVLAGKWTAIGAANPGYALTVMPDTLFPAMNVGDGVSMANITAAASLTSGTWATVAGDRQADGKARCYVGGTVSSASGGTASGSAANSLPLRSGAYGDTPYENFGLSSWTAVFSRALTTQEHADLASWNGRVATQPEWLDEAATLLVNADEPGTRRAYRAANFVGSHFTGDTPDTDEYLYYWAGTPYASESVRVPTSYARAIVPVQPDEPEGIVGALWYDSDDEQMTVDVSYVQPNEPTGAAEGSFWLDTDDPAAHTDADHTGLAVVGHTHDYAASTHNHDSQYYTETEVNNLLATKSTGYYFVPPSAGTRQYMRLFTLNGNGASSGANLSALLSGLGDYGNAHRATVLLHAGQRGDNGFVLTAHEWNAPLVTQPVRLFYKQISTYVFEVWAYFASFSLSQGLQVLAASGATVNVDSATASAPSGLTEITIQPAKEWNRIAVINPTGTSSTVGNLRFSSIPTIYNRLRVRSSYLQYGTTSNSGNLWVRFNGNTSTNHYATYQYHTTGTWSGTSGTSASGDAYAAYAYFYAGVSSVYNVFEMEIANHGLGEVNWLARTRAHTGAGATYPYRTESVGHWASASKITQIDFWTDNAYTWSASSVVTLEGSLEI